MKAAPQHGRKATATEGDGQQELWSGRWIGTPKLEEFNTQFQVICIALKFLWQ